MRQKTLLVTSLLLLSNTWRYEPSSYTDVVLDRTNDASDGDRHAIVISSTADDQWVIVKSGKIALAGTDAPSIEFDAKSRTGKGTIEVSVVTPQNETVSLGTTTLTQDYATRRFDLSAYADRRYLRFFLTATLPAPDDIYIDNVKVRDIADRDLSVMLSTPATANVGICENNIAVKVKNDGAETVGSYAVRLYADDVLVADEAVTESIAPTMAEQTLHALPFSHVQTAGTVVLRAEVVLDGDEATANNTSETNIELVASTLPQPMNIALSGRSLSWQQPDVSANTTTEGFDDQTLFQPFATGNLDAQWGSYGEWLLYDGDNRANYSLTGYTFSGNGSPSAWQVFTPASLGDDFLTKNPSFAPVSGEQYLMAWCPGNGSAANNWLISPALPGVEQTITFSYAVLTTQYGAETFEVLASTSGTAIADFTLVKSFSANSLMWQQAQVTLPEGTRHFAIRHTSADKFGLRLDDVSFMAGGNVLTAYRVYQDGVLCGETDADVYLFSIPVDGDGIWGVAAVYEGGQSAPVYVQVATGIHQIENRTRYALGLSRKSSNSNWLDLQGHRVTSPRQGSIYLHQGRKVVFRNIR